MKKYNVWVLPLHVRLFLGSMKLCVFIDFYARVLVHYTYIASMQGFQNAMILSEIKRRVGPIIVFPVSPFIVTVV